MPGKKSTVQPGQANGTLYQSVPIQDRESVNRLLEEKNAQHYGSMARKRLYTIRKRRQPDRFLRCDFIG